MVFLVLESMRSSLPHATVHGPEPSPLPEFRFDKNGIWRRIAGKGGHVKWLPDPEDGPNTVRDWRKGQSQREAAAGAAAEGGEDSGTDEEFQDDDDVAPAAAKPRRAAKKKTRKK